MTVIWRIKGENCNGMDFTMEVAATLPEVSEWTLIKSVQSALSDLLTTSVTQRVDNS